MNDRQTDGGNDDEIVRFCGLCCDRQIGTERALIIIIFIHQRDTLGKNRMTIREQSPISRWLIDVYGKNLQPPFNGTTDRRTWHNDS